MLGFRSLLLPWILIFSSYATATEQTVEVSHHNGVYEIEMSFEVQAPADRVRGLLTDFNHLTELNPAIKESEIIEQSENSTRVHMLASDCVLFFCSDIRRVEDVSDDGNGGLSAQIVPQMSDFKYGITHWSFEDVDGITQVSYSSMLKPDIWVPPLIGPAIFRSRIQHHIEILRDKLQSLASQAP